MGYKTFCTIGFMLLFGFGQQVLAEPIAIVTAANSPLPKLTFETLKLIYLRKIQIDAQGNHWIPINLPITHPLRHDFSVALFSMLPEDQEDYWNGQYFHGITPPPVMPSEEAVLRFISSTPGAIGYVQHDHVDGRVKVILSLPVGGR
jgi:ABC-type phosphate transport system substrate-binding protein